MNEEIRKTLETVCGNLPDAFTKISSAGDQSAATPINSSSAASGSQLESRRLVQNQSPQPGICTTDVRSGPRASTSRDSLGSRDSLVRDVRSSAHSLQTSHDGSQNPMPARLNEA